ncbi:MAG TPA: HEAT repeat domain-containing protein [Roseimicrobium sp.]|nr:HEAT repeat domain-containing protein [Roseimicrobium sp.]
MNTPEAWKTFLDQHASAVSASEWPGSPGASIHELSRAEKRLASQLPPSYRTFLQTSNGWTRASRSVPILLPIEKVQWFRKFHREWIQAYQFSEPLDHPEAEYFDYANSDPVQFHPKHLQHTLCISEIGDDAILLLNPMVVWPDGEWETWFFASWFPGVQRFRSFADWFKHEHADLAAGEFTHDLKPGELPTVYLDPPSKPHRRIRPREKVHDFKTVLKSLKSENATSRRTAAKRMGRIRTAESFHALCELLKAEQDHYVRMEIIESLGRVGGDAAVDFLLPWIDDEELGSNAAHAIATMTSERAANVSLNLLSAGHQHAPVMAYPLSQRCENRAIPHLAKLMTRPEFTSHHFRPYWGQTIAEFGNIEAFEALRPFTTHPDIQVRTSAFNGIGHLAFAAKKTTIKSNARELLGRALQTEAEPELRRAIQLSLDILPKSASKPLTKE